MNTATIKRWARELGFSMCGIAPAQPSPRLAAYLRWVKAGMHGEMSYMARPDRIIRREDLNVIVPEAHSMIIVGMDYFSGRLPEAIRSDPTRGLISNYAWGEDYHDVMLERLTTLANRLEGAAWKAYVDTGAILERSHAEQAGLGFTGKNTMLIGPQRGSFFFLGEIITDLPLEADKERVTVGCGTCTRCLTACPTDAFPTPHTLDARRCISYLTIEYKGIIPQGLRPRMQNWLYGCDICQEVCPWQRFANVTPYEGFHRSGMDDAAPRLADILSLTEEGFATRFAASPIKRIKRERLLRNACIAAGNSGETALLQPLLPLLEDASPLIRAHAVWAVKQLGPHHLARLAANETDETVLAEYP